jgi:hypothetical protein
MMPATRDGTAALDPRLKSWACGPILVKHRVEDETGAAYTQACRYPDGSNVLCATVIELDGGVIAGQTVVQVWDEA